MSLLNWFKPLDKVLDTVDKAVTDKDLKNKLNAEIAQAQIDLQKLAQETYRHELATTTIPWVDALHKMGRQIGSVVNTLVVGFVLIYMVKRGCDVTFETAAAIASAVTPMSIYNFVKGKGRPTV